MLGFFMIFFIFLVMSTKISFLCDFIENHKKKVNLRLVSITYSPCRRNICQRKGILREIKLSFNFYNILTDLYRKRCSKITGNVIFRHFKSKLTKVGIWIQAGASSACHMHQISSHLTIYSKFHHITFNGSIFCNFPLFLLKQVNIFQGITFNTGIFGHTM